MSTDGDDGPKTLDDASRSTIRRDTRNETKRRGANTMRLTSDSDAGFDSALVGEEVVAVEKENVRGMMRGREILTRELPTLL